VNDPQSIFVLATLLGAVGMWLMLPRVSLRGRMAGVALAAASLGLIASQVPRLGEWVSDGVFLVLAGVTLVAAVATVTLRNPVYCAIWFGLSLLGTAGLFFLQGAQFVAVATVVVYAGAILVTFLFVLMLAQPEGRAHYDRMSWEGLISSATGAVIVGILSMTITCVLATFPVKGPPPPTEVLAGEHVASVGAELFGRHLIAVEVAGVLLLAALVGAAVIVGQARSAHSREEDNTIVDST